jgi:foldase protein PrsA
VGAKSGQKKKPPAANSGRAAGTKRLALILFAAIFVLLFVGFAIAEGIGGTSVPSGDAAVVSSVPEGAGNVSEAEVKRAIVQQIAGAQLKKAPKPGSKKAEEIKEAAMGELLDLIWINGEAEELGLSVTDKEIETELAQIKKANFPTPAAYKEFLESSKLTPEDVNRKVELQVASTKIQELVAGLAPPPSSEAIAENYEENKASTYTTKPSRDVRLIINEDKGEVEAALVKLEADDSPASWKAVAKKYSADPSTSAKGGLQTELTEELLASAGPLKKAIFGAATGEVLGPVKFQNTYVVFEVDKLNPEKTQTLGEVRAQITAQLEEQAKQAKLQEFVSEYQSKWTARTQCADGFVIKRCANYKASAHPEEASPKCYEAHPRLKKGETLECPASVVQTKPARPGSITVLTPAGEQLVQRPRPAGLEEAAAEATSGLPEGVAPATGE